MAIGERNAQGCAYGIPPSAVDPELTQVGPGTPCGELLRRYWHPISVSRSVTTRPKKVRVLGEDLILFRDGKGRVGLLTPRCAHRGASLYYGKVDDTGIRCCYHGWHFDVEGRCTDQPCEPEGGSGKDRIRQPWYPVQEHYGLVFAYMGPPEKRPTLPRWDLLENLDPSETIVASGPTGFGVGADSKVQLVPWNWLLTAENTLDPFHIPILHASISGLHFDNPDMAVKPEVVWEYTELGVHYKAAYPTVVRVSPLIFPNVRSVPDGRLKAGPGFNVNWLVPVDDAHHCLFYAARMPKSTSGEIGRVNPANRKPWSEMTEEEHQRSPDDWEALHSQGPVPTHSHEHLVTSDKGVAMLRRLLRQQIRLVQNGEDPIGVSFDPQPKVYPVGSGNLALDRSCA